MQSIRSRIARLERTAGPLAFACPPRIRTASPLHRIADALERMSPPKPRPPLMSSASRDTPIEELNLSNREWRIMKNLNIRTLGELANCTYDELMRVQYVGRITVDAIRNKLATLGLKLKGD